MAVSPDTGTTPRVSNLAIRIAAALRAVGSGWVEGEVQKLRRASSGHVYFSLADEDATIECCVWRSHAARIAQWPREGTLVQARYTKVDFYGRSGRISLHVDELRPTGEGELLARKRAVLERLVADGLVARARRPLPAFPRRVGVIAGRDSDAKTDVISALRARWPSVHIVHRPALVEGVRAVDSVIAALAQLQDIDGVDVIVLARGGGGVRDLVPFDDERLCRAVFACAAPVVTSIGHTAQRPNCDHVAAAYADVPARTAEIVVPGLVEVTGELDRYARVLGRAAEDVRRRCDDVAALWARVRLQGRLERRGTELESIGRHLRSASREFQRDRVRGLDEAGHRLAAARGRVPSVAELQSLGVRLGPAARRAARRHAELDRSLEAMRERVGRDAGRRLADGADALNAAAGELAGGARRCLGGAEQALRHVGELIAARDFRRSGWVLAGDAAGRPLRTAGELEPGTRLRLQFHDGTAEAAVTRLT